MTTSTLTGRYSPQRPSGYGRLARLFDSYLLTGTVDPSVKARGQRRTGPTSPEFSGLLASWSHDMEQRGLGPSTRNGFGGLACDYLNFLEAGGTFFWDALITFLASDKAKFITGTTIPIDGDYTAV